MVTKPGYKQTDLGVIPAEWEVRTLKSLNFDISDGNYSSKYPKASEFRLIGVPFIRANNVRDMDVVDDDMRFISSNQHKELQKGHLKKNDVLITTRGDIGQIALVPDRHVNSNINAQIVRINTENQGVDHRFFAYSMGSKSSQAQLNNLQTGSALKQLPVGKLVQLQLVIPPLPEQRAIAGVLSDADALIGEVDKLIAKKRDIKQAAMQLLLTGKQRLAGFNDDWNVKKIGEFAACTSGGTPSTSVAEYWRGTVKWMSSGELNFKAIWDVDGRITELGLKNSSATMIPEKCVLVGLAGQGKTRGTVAMNMIPLCTNQSIAAILPSQEFVPEYLYYNLDSRYDELRSLSTGDSGRGGLNLTIIKSILVPIPKIKEQTAIATVLSDMDAEIAALERRRDKTRAIKQGMMQELLAGNTRLI